jgi:hypothetical protein
MGDGMKAFYLSLVLLLTGCATLTKGTDQTITLDTPGHPGALCKLTSKGVGQREVTTPAIVNLPKSRHDIAVQCNLGCLQGTTVIPSNLEGMTAGNVLAGGVIGLGVDSATGAMNKYAEYNAVTLVADQNCQATQ